MTAIARSPARHSRRPRPSLAARRFGYVVAAAVNALMLVAVNRWPGWEVVPVLTEETELVLPAVNASIVVGLAAQLVYLVRDTRWIRALGDIVTTAAGLVAMVRVWTVWPLDLPSDGFDWEVVARVLLVVGVVGSVIGVLTAFSRLVTGLVSRPE